MNALLYYNKYIFETILIVLNVLLYYKFITNTFYETILSVECFDAQAKMIPIFKKERKKKSLKEIDYLDIYIYFFKGTTNFWNCSLIQFLNPKSLCFPWCHISLENLLLLSFNKKSKQKKNSDTQSGNGLSFSHTLFMPELWITRNNHFMSVCDDYVGAIHLQKLIPLHGLHKIKCLNFPMVIDKNAYKVFLFLSNEYEYCDLVKKKIPENFKSSVTMTNKISSDWFDAVIESSNLHLSKWKY